MLKFNRTSALKQFHNGIWCNTVYIPLFNIPFSFEESHDFTTRDSTYDRRHFKMKNYHRKEHVKSIAGEFIELARMGYTHVVNMPGAWSTICYYARCNQISVLDQRISKNINQEEDETDDDNSDKKP